VTQTQFVRGGIKIMAKCVGCGQFVVFGGVKNQYGTFCGQVCFEVWAPKNGVKLLPAFTSPGDFQKALYTMAGRQDTLEVWPDKICITPKGLLGFLNKGLAGTKEIPIASITAILFKESGMMAGYLQFTLVGGQEKRSGILAATKDENSFLFSGAYNGMALEIKQYLDNRLKELRQPALL
jgi:hypothetical protein